MTQYRDLQQFICDSVPTALLRDLIRQRQLEDPALTKTAIAESAGYSNLQALQRAVGLEPTPRRGKDRPPTYQTSIDIGIAAGSCEHSATHRTKSPACSHPYPYRRAA